MRTVLLASLRRHTRRYVASAVAVVIGVAFVIVTDALSNATREGLTADAGAPFAGVELVVRPDDDRDSAALLEKAEEADLPVGVVGHAMEPVHREGVRLTETAYVSEASTDPAMQYLDVLEGRHPTSPGEALADANAAKSSGVAVGDTLVVGSGEGAPVVEVVGLVDSPAARSADLYVPWETLSQLEGTLWVQALAWGGTADEALDVAPEATVESVEEYVAQLQAEIARGVDYLAYMALLFLAIALFVAVMVIANTFSILFAQRMRDFALLRCVGVTRRQLRRSVRLEALLLGLVASCLGVLVGLGLGVGAVALVGTWFDDMGPVSFDPAWIVGAVVVGTAVTLGAAWLPTRAVTRVTPLAALRPDTGVDVRTAAGRWRVALGFLVLVGGVALLAMSIAGSNVPLMLAGGSATFLGVLLLGPLLVPASIRVASRAFGDGPVRRLATGNAVRNPRRTATTAASLLVGVTLTTAVLTGLATSRTALDDEMDLSYPLDQALTATSQPLPADLADRVGAVEGVTGTVTVPGAVARVGGLDRPVLEVDGRQSVVRGPRDLAPAAGTALVPYSVVNELTGPAARQWERDGTVTVAVDGRSVALAAEQGDGWGESVLVPSGTLAALGADPEPMAVWARVAEGTDAEDLLGDLEALAAASGSVVAGGHGNREWVDLQVDVLTGAVVGLLGIAVVIALVGIANTLGLSVLERARENALLRAMGLTRSQLRRAMATEGLLLSLVATVLGTGLGIAFAWVGIKVMVAQAVGGVSMTLPVGQLAAVVAVAAVAGLAACVLPARRAGQVAPAAGLAVD